MQCIQAPKLLFLRYQRRRSMSTTLTIYTKASTSAAWGALALVQYLTDEFALGAGLTTEFEAEHANGIPCELKSEG